MAQRNVLVERFKRAALSRAAADGRRRVAIRPVFDDHGGRTTDAGNIGNVDCRPAPWPDDTPRRPAPAPTTQPAPPAPPARRTGKRRTLLDRIDALRKKLRSI